MEKKSIMGLVLIIVQSIFTLSYSNEPKQATIWYCISMYQNLSGFQSSSFSSSFSSVTYLLQGDTIFGDIRYTTFCGEDGTFWGAMRKTDDGQQVYYRPGEGHGKFPTSLGKEYLLYDFGVKEGDTTIVYSGFMDTADENSAPDTPDEFVMDSMVVVSIQVIDGRKHVQIQNIHASMQQVEWIEGIGTRNILFTTDRNRSAGNNFGLYTLCAADDLGNILYSFDTDHLGIHNDNCEGKTLAIEEIPVPNPIASKILRNGQILILRGDKTFTLQGQEVK